MTRYVCLHGHFYQPPRENPWLEAIELQDSAYPHHDWNERIAAECYAPNAASRILDKQERLVGIVNNYSRISFNFGPTLLAWLAAQDPATYAAIIEADVESRAHYSGHGSALAQAFNHMILPLANARDRATQVSWGLRDFRWRFGREAEGMWLPETAVDLATLDVLAEHGVRFTVLAPRQAARVRRIGGSRFVDVRGGRIDPSRAYLQKLPSGRTIALFFYDGPISQAVAFERLLASGDQLAGRLTNAFDDKRDWPQLSHIATDGETYGHHHRHGDMALAYALRQIEKNDVATLTNYGEFLERHPPTHEVQIIDETSWSCAHGIERWRSDCGCRSGGNDWQQGWRAPLRQALDELRDAVAPLYEQHAGQLLLDPWAARNAYIDVMLDRSRASVERFLAAHARRTLEHAEQVRALQLLELQRHAQLMYTSCGWFFDDISGIESVQVLQYAGRVTQLGEQLFGVELEPRLLATLEQARSNDPAHGDGRRVYEANVRPIQINLLKVGAHYAASWVEEDRGKQANVYCYSVGLADHKVLRAGRVKLVVGRIEIESQVTRKRSEQTFAMLHLGDHNVGGGVRVFRSPEDYDRMVTRLLAAFDRGNLTEVLRLVDDNLDESIDSLGSLFRDDQRRIVRKLLETTLIEVEASHRQVFERHAPLLRYLANIDVPPPPALVAAGQVVLSAELRRTAEQLPLQLPRMGQILAEAVAQRLPLDTAGVAFALGKTIGRLATGLAEDPGDMERLGELHAAIDLAAAFPTEVEVLAPQMIVFRMSRELYPERRAQADAGAESAKAWTELFTRLAASLEIALPDES